MTLIQEMITIVACAAGSWITRFLPFMIFRDSRPTPEYVQYLGKALPSAVFAMLVVYCIRNVDFVGGVHGAPELISIILTAILHAWRRNMLVSIAGGTVCYMLLIHFVFVL